MSPIFVRPVREQLEHDRLIRHLLVKYKRKFEAAANVGDEQVAPTKVGQATFFPDLVLTAGKKLAGLVEVESGESVNNLEAMAEWVPFGRARVPFHLYVPVLFYDAARRLCEANHVSVAEIWTYRASLEGFDLVRMFHDASGGPKTQGPKAVTTTKPPVAIKPAAPSKPAAPVKPAAPIKTVPAKPAIVAPQKPTAAPKTMAPARHAPAPKPASAKAKKPAAKPASKAVAAKPKSKPASRPVKKAKAKPGKR